MLEDKEPPSCGERKKRSIMSAGMSARLFQRTLHSHLHVLSLDLRFKLEKPSRTTEQVVEPPSLKEKINHVNFLKQRVLP